MTPNEEYEVLSGIRLLPKVLEEVKALREAWLGSLDGANEGGLHRINRLHEDFYHPENSKDSIHNRIRELENTEIKRTGFLFALSMVSGAIGWAIMAFIYWMTGSKK